jgi:drug/metabolite transporter (DMT)-like permease
MNQTHLSGHDLAAALCVVVIWGTNFVAMKFALHDFTPFSLGVPVVGLATGMFVLGEFITAWQWAGIALVVAALACVLLGGRSSRRALFS